MSLPYYPMYPRDFYDGTQRMTLEQKGAYIMVLNLMYTRGEALEDEDGYLARYVGCSIRKWQKLRLELIGLGKLVAENGVIRNSRADEEMMKRVSYQDQQRENRSKPNKNKAEESPSRTTRAKPEPEPESKIGGGVERASVLGFTSEQVNEIEARVRKAANGSVNVASPAIVSIAPILHLMNPKHGQKACAIEDVETGITKAAAGLHARQAAPIFDWNYFEKPILRERDKRLKPLPEPEKTHERHGQGGYRRTSGEGGGRDGDRGPLAVLSARMERRRRAQGDQFASAGGPDPAEDCIDQTLSARVG